MENVRVAGDKRNQGIGTQLIRHAVSLARKEEAMLLQLMTDKRRPDARRFREKRLYRHTRGDETGAVEYPLTFEGRAGSRSFLLERRGSPGIDAVSVSPGGDEIDRLHFISCRFGAPIRRAGTAPRGKLLYTL